MAEGALYRSTADGLVAAVVRTPAGAKRYGQPIGSVIVPDVVPQVRAPKARVSTVPSPSKGHAPTDAEVAKAASAAKQNRHPRAFGEVDTAAYLDAAGYNERPTVLPTGEFDAYQGKTLVNYNDGREQLDEFWRGTEVPKWGTDPYANLTTAEPEEFFVGSGIYANGTYIGNKTTAKMFVSETPHTNRSERLPGGGTLVRIKIHPDARVIETTEIPNYDRLTPHEVVKWAVDHNYDIVSLYGTRDPAAGISVLNRSVMVVEELKAALSAKPTFAVGSTVEWSGSGKTVQGEVLKDLGDVLLVRPPWGSPPLRLNPRRLKPVTGGAGNEDTGRVPGAGAVGEPGPDLSAGGPGDPGLAATAAGLPAEGRSSVPAALGTLDRALTAAGDSWRWQLRDKNGRWIEMGAEVKWLARGRWLHGTVIGSPSPGIATVEELLTKIQRDIPSARLEVVNRAFALLERVEQARDEKGRVDWRALDLNAPKQIPLPPEVTTPKIPEQIQAQDLKPGDVMRRYDDALVRVLSIDDRDDDYTQFTGVILTGPTAGTVTETSVKNNLPVQYQGSPPLQDFDQDVIAPARARLDALKDKYPDGMAAAIEQALAPPSAGPEPEMSDRLKELGRDVEVVRWMFDEQSEQDHLRELEFEYAPQDEIEAVREEVRRLSPEVMGGKILEYHTLLGEHRLAYAEWIDKQTGDSDTITPHSDQAKEILAEVREIGAMVRVGIDIDLAQRGTVRDRPIDREIRAAKVKKADLIKKRVASKPTDPGHAEVIEELRLSMQAVNDLEAQAKGIPDPAVDPEYADEFDTDVARYRTRWKRRRERAQQTISELVGTTDETKQAWVSKDPRTRINSTEKHRYLTKDEKQAMTDGLLRYPASWVERFDRNNYTVSFADRGWNSDHEKHITISSSDGGDLSEGSNRIWATILHEQGHTMEKSVPGLSGLEAMWWHDRMGELSPKTFHPDDGALFPDTNQPMKPRNINRPTSYPYTLKMYGNVYSKSNKSWEIFTTGVQEVLGDGKTDFSYNGVEDTDLWEFTMGALLTLDGQSAAAATGVGI